MDVTAFNRHVPPQAILYDNANLIISGLAAQAVSLSAALLLLRKAQLRRRLMVTFAQVCGLIVYCHVLVGDIVSMFSTPQSISRRRIPTSTPCAPRPTASWERPAWRRTMSSRP